jgi:site-specific DNA-methyltransferase (adenine-specific)
MRGVLTMHFVPLLQGDVQYPLIPSAAMKKATELQLNLGDCIEGVRSLPDASVDVVVTSPPYNLGIEYASYEDSRGRAEFLDWCVQWATEVKRVLKGDGSFFLNVGASPRNPLFPHELILRLVPLFTLQNTFHWIKSITVEPKKGPPISVGHFKPLNSRRFITDCHEYLFHLSKDGKVELDRLAIGVEYADKSNIARWGHTKGEDRRCRGNVWYVPYKTILSRKGERPHPATFPVRLAAQCIRLHGIRDGMTVMDPFLGIGHAALAAQECGVARFIGYEIDRGYFEEASRRLAAPRQEALL